MRELVARNGLIALSSSIVSGSLNVTQGITGSLYGTASWAYNTLTASFLSGSATTSSYSVSSSYALTSSYSLNSDLLDGKDSTTFATTGSNVFKGSQTIDGNLYMSGSFRLVYANDPTTNMLFGMFDGSTIYGPYYQLFGNQYSTLSQRGGAEFVYDIRNNTDANFHIASFDGASWTQKFLVNDTGAQVTGSLNVTNGITGSLYGTASWALNTLTASYIGTASSAASASYSLTASYIATASWANNAVSSSYTLSSSYGLSSSYALSSSYGLSASYALSSSYALNTTSASYAATSSYGTTFYVSGVFNINSASYNYQENPTVNSGSYRVISSVPTASYRAAFFDYVMFKGAANVRAGTVMTVWSASYAEYTEIYTQDIGDTSGVILQTAISTGSIQLQSTASSDGWTIRSLVRML